jgi:predicted anti-sigma-YlaC factor YlaD
MTDCTAIREQFDAYLDGDLPPADHARVTAHLPDCAGCQAELESLRAVLAATSTLPRAILPDRDLWTDIERRIGAAPVAGRIRRAPADTMRRGLRIAAAIGLILLGAGLASLWHTRPAPSAFAATQARYAAASAELAERLARDTTTLAPGTRAVVERNLAIVDAAIREAETALAADPGSAPLQQMIVARYEQRLALLRHATHSARAES